MNSDKPEYFSATGTIAFIKKENALYQGCANEVDGKSCNKKVKLPLTFYTAGSAIRNSKSRIFEDLISNGPVFKSSGYSYGLNYYENWII